jgi:hypothetical protein
MRGEIEPTLQSVMTNFGAAADETLRSIPGGEVIAKARQLGAAQAQRAGASTFSQFLAAIGAPSPGDLVMVGPLFHGGARKFDKFSREFIRSGTGGQAQGFGFYFAQNPGVAKSYKQQVGSPSVRVGGGDPITVLSEGVSVDRRTVATRLRDRVELGAKPEEAVDVLRRDLNHEVFGGRPDFPEQSRLRSKAELEELERMVAEGIEIEPGGALIEATVDIDLDDLLDWDAPLSQQSEKVRAGLQQHFDVEAFEDITGQQAYHKIAEGQAALRGAPAGDFDFEAASSALSEAGIPGNKYLDQGSRGAGEGTRNIVIFPDAEDRIAITKINDESVAPAARTLTAEERLRLQILAKQGQR